MAQLPAFFRLRQKFEAPRVADIPGEVQRQLAALELGRTIKPGDSVAITAGSRGIANVALITKAIVDHVKSLSAKPFVVPAMGSHGGGTPEGQLEVLDSYGITEEYLGCPIRSSMETVIVCQTAEGFDVHFDKHAFEADHVLVSNRIKPHTNFVGDIESGLMKMMLIGLGKHEGAKVYHRAIQDYSFGQIVRSVAGRVLDSCRIAGGLAIVENPFDQTGYIEAIAPGNFETREKELLAMAKRLLPRLPFEAIDLLIIDEIGKNISGTGMDTNVVGRKFNEHRPSRNETPKIKRIMVRGLTEETHGNASGIGLVEFATSRAIAQTDIQKTRINCITAGHVTAAMLPIDFPTDRETIETALSTLGMVAAEETRIVWIRNTLDLVEIECSAALLAECEGRNELEVLTTPRPLPFDAEGNLPLAGVHALQA